jgi:hypothetical protein
MKTKLALALCLTVMATPARARNAEDYWCGKGKDRIHLMMWIAKVQEPDRDDEGKLIRDSQGNLSWGRAADGRTYSQHGIINHKLPANHPKWVTVVPNGSIRFDTEDNIYLRGQKCTVFTEKDQDKYGVGYFGPRSDLRYPHMEGKILEVRSCVSVIEPPPEVMKDPEYNEDKWLAMREGPGPQFKIIIELGGHANNLEADATQGDWTHISNVSRLSSSGAPDQEIVGGWVRSKYIKTFPCKHKSKSEEPKLEDVLADWCKRNDPQFTAQSCIRLKSILEKNEVEALRADPEKPPLPLQPYAQRNYKSGGAFGAEMPEELWGYWCHKGSDWARCKEETWDGLCCFIDRKEMSSEHTRCKTLSVRKVKIYTWVIKQRCAYGSVEDKKDPDGEGSETKTTQYERRGVHLYAKEIK